jgi:orotate phosphoribosyltransferase
MSQEFLDLLSAKRGHFQYESGHHGDLWLELDLLFLHPKRLQQFVIALANRLSRYEPTAVCGPLVGGALIAHMVATELGTEFYYTEPIGILQSDALYPVKYSLPGDYDNRLHNKSIVIVDDVINAGSAVRATLSELKHHGAHPLAIGSLLMLGTTAKHFFAEQGIPVESIEALPNNLWAPTACPLCASKIPFGSINQGGFQ